MATVTVYTSKDASAIDASTYNWSGSDLHHPVGWMVGNAYLARSVIYFPISFNGMQSITSAVMWLRGSKSGASHCIGNTNSKTMYVRRQGKTWKEDTPETEGVWGNRTNDFTTLQGATTSGQASKVFSSGITDGTWYSIDITDIVRAWFTGSANNGVVLINSNEITENAALEFYSREKGSAYKPYVIVTYTVNTAPNAPTALSPTGDQIVPTLTPVLSGTFSDPDSGDSMSGYQIQAFQDDGTTIIWDTGTIADTSASFSRTFAGTALAYGTFYKWKARTKDAAGAWGPYSTLQRFQVVNATGGDTPPPALTDLAATPDDTSILLTWTESTLTALEFDHYEVYRRRFGDVEWVELISIYDITTPTYTDLTPEFGTTYEYKVTQFKNITGGFDVESDDSNIVQAQVAGEPPDAWSVQGADGLAEHIFDLPVTDGPLSTPIQQEVFEPLGSRRKTVVRGRVLGAEGTLTCEWDVSERDTALDQIRYITENRGPHILRSPFGDVWLVEFSGPDRTDLPAGHLRIAIAWTEVA